MAQNAQRRPLPHRLVNDHEVSLNALYLFPVKSCAGLAVDQALLIETGFEFDRAWMVVDQQGEFISQRERPRLQLVRPTLNHDDLTLRAPGMLALQLSLDSAATACRVRVWDDEVAAYDMGALAAQWIGDFLGQPARLVRFDPEQRRLADRRWTGPLEAPTAFVDGFPLLVTSTASLEELNRRLAAPVTIDRFRPNLVLEGLDAHGEDFIDELSFETLAGPVRLKMVKPCTRCSIPDVDPRSAETGHAVNDALASYRADMRMDGGLTFGMNAVIVEGVERALTPGLQARVSLRF
jgi:uncharacterized protein YcbX